MDKLIMLLLLLHRGNVSPKLKGFPSDEVVTDSINSGVRVSGWMLHGRRRETAIENVGKTKSFTPNMVSCPRIKALNNCEISMRVSRRLKLDNDNSSSDLVTLSEPKTRAKVRVEVRAIDRDVNHPSPKSMGYWGEQVIKTMG